MMHLLTNMIVFTALDLPFAEALSGPLDWFSNQNIVVQVFVMIFGILGFYLFLRLVFKIVEKIAGLFG
ncbi:MAG: hypothetical protein EB060_06195 [Proteobacteria bacterium]|nr:hypothetical protein [Pseudomonadota bacterium]